MNNYRKFLIAAFVGICLFGGAAWFINQSKDSEQDQNNSEQSEQNAQSEQTEDKNENETDEEFPSSEGPSLLIGPSDYSQKIIEFTDYKCPNCNKFHNSTFKQLLNENPGLAFEIHLVPNIGPDSGIAARGAYCSHEHGDVFSEYHDRVFDYLEQNYYSKGQESAANQDVLTEDVLAAIYSDAGGKNSAKFIECINSDQPNEYINNDFLLSADYGLRGTPSFAVGKAVLSGPKPISVFNALLEENRN